MKSHQQLIDRFMDWDLARRRLKRFRSIVGHFDESIMRKHSNTSPYYCHPIGWRLGVWQTDEVFQRLDMLLEKAAEIPGWKREFQSLQSNTDFGSFWGLSWQLEAANIFRDRGVRLSWRNRGPDFEVTDTPTTFYVECYSFQKAFAIKLYIEELMGKLSPRIRVFHTPYFPFTRPKKSADLDVCFDQLFQPFLDPKFLDDKLRESEDYYPVKIPVPDGLKDLTMAVWGTDTSRYRPTDLGGTGDPDQYLKHAVIEAMNNKRSSNALVSYRPNVLMVNFLLTEDYQGALHRGTQLSNDIPIVDFGDSLDAIIGCVCGIDGKCTKPLVWSRREDHPVRHYFDGFVGSG